MPLVNFVDGARHLTDEQVSILNTCRHKWPQKVSFGGSINRVCNIYETTQVMHYIQVEQSNIRQEQARQAYQAEQARKAQLALQQKVTTLTTQVGQLNTATADQTKKIQAQNALLQESQRKAKIAADNQKLMQAKIETLINGVKNLKESNRDLTTQLQAHNLLLEQKRVQQETLTRTISQLTLKIESLNSQLAIVPTLTQVIADLSSSVALLKNQSRSQTSEIGRLEQEIAELRGKLGNQTREIGTLTRNILQLRDQTAGIQDVVNQMLRAISE